MDCENCTTEALGDCPACYLASGVGCGHGEICHDCKHRGGTMPKFTKEEIEAGQKAQHAEVVRAHKAYVEAAKLVAGEVLEELARARAKFPIDQASPHEGYAVLLEELDELWDEVKANHPERSERMRKEAIQVAAMAIRFVLEST